MKSLVMLACRKRFLSFKLIGLFLGTSLAVCTYVFSVHAVSFITVDRTDDTVVTACTAAPNDCSFRGALTIAQTGDSIGFDTTVFPTNATTTINVTRALPAITLGTLTIQGNGNNNLNNATVMLDGSGAGAGVNGLTITSNNNVIRLVSVKSFAGDGILINGGANNVIGDCNYAMELFQNGGYGLHISGESADGNNFTYGYVGITTVAAVGGNGLGGIRVEGGADNNQLGSCSEVVARNQGPGITISDATTTGTKIGGQIGSIALGNQGVGILITNGASGVQRIGSILSIVGNTGDGGAD